MSIGDTMTERIEFFIPWTPYPKQGDRSRIVAAGSRQFIRHYQSADVVDNARTLASLMIPYRPATPIEEPVSLRLVVSSYFRKGDSARRRRMGALARSTKPDADNIIKQVGDVLQKGGFIVNDSLIFDAHVTKVWSEVVGMSVCIEVVPDDLHESLFFAKHALGVPRAKEATAV